MGKALPDKSNCAYSLFNALSKTQISHLTTGFSICQSKDVFLRPLKTNDPAPDTFIAQPASSLLTIGSVLDDTSSNSKVIGAY